MNWLFRVASRPMDGGGHVGRCRVLAGQMREMGAKVVFSCDDGGQAWLPVLQRESVAVMAGAEPALPWSGAVVDGYHYDHAEYLRLKALTGRLAVIVDEQVPDAAANIVIAPGRPIAQALPGVMVLDGLQHALVDPAFSAVPGRPAAVPERVLISFGLRDSRNATGLVLDAFAICAADGWHPRVQVAMGRSAVHLADVAQKVAQLPQAELLVEPDLRQFLAEIDLVVGGGGVGMLERLAAGRPSITIALAPNQIPQSEYCSRQNATLLLGRIEDLSAPAVAAALLALRTDNARRQAMALAGRRLIDAQGARRVAMALVKPV